MKRSSFKLHRPGSARSSGGFTMLELLVVIAIIVFLVSITVAVVSNALQTSRTNATKATIRKIDGLLSDRLTAFALAMEAQNLKGQTRSDVMKWKNLFIAAFPQDGVEAFGDASNTATDITASSEALYEFLTNGESYNVASVDTDAFSSSEVMDTDKDGRKEFVDNWGQPLRFYRWPTRLIRPAPSGSESTAQSYNGNYPSGSYAHLVKTQYGTAGIDAKVLLGNLSNELGKDAEDPLSFINPRTVNVADFERNFHTPETWSLPLVVSAGPDGVLGLYEPTDEANFGHLAQPRNDSELDNILDNITNRNLEQ